MVEFPVQNLGEKVEIDGETYFLQHKPKDRWAGDELDFLIKHGDGVENQERHKLPKALQIRELDTLRNESGDIVAVMVYSENSGELTMAAVHKGYRRKGLAAYLGNHVVNIMIDRAEDKTKPVEIGADAEREGGAALLQRLKRDFGDRIILKVNEHYLRMSEDDLPEGMVIYMPNWSFDEAEVKDEDISEIAETYSKSFIKGQQTEQIKEKLTELLKNEPLAMVIMDEDNNDKSIGVAGYQTRREATDKEDPIVELSVYVSQPEAEDGKISKILLTEQEERILKEDMDTNIWLIAHNPKLIDYARRTHYEEAGLEEYLPTIPIEERESRRKEIEDSNAIILVMRGINSYRQRVYE